jgi:hypothetical protein
MLVVLRSKCVRGVGPSSSSLSRAASGFDRAVADRQLTALHFTERSGSRRDRSEASKRVGLCPDSAGVSTRHSDRSSRFIGTRFSHPGRSKGEQFVTWHLNFDNQPAFGLHACGRRRNRRPPSDATVALPATAAAPYQRVGAARLTLASAGSTLTSWPARGASYQREGPAGHGRRGPFPPASTGETARGGRADGRPRMPGGPEREPEPVRCRNHRRWPFVNGVDDLGVVDPRSSPR